MGNKHPKEKKGPGDVVDGPKQGKPSKGSGKKNKNNKDINTSCPDLGGAVPYKTTEDESKVTVTIYRSMRDVRRHPSEIPPSRNDVNVRILRKSTSGMPETEKPSTLPRNFMRSKSATLPGGRAALTPGETHYQEFPSLRRRVDSLSTKASNQNHKTSRSSMEKPNQFIIPVEVNDLPGTDVIKQKISKFESFFVKSLVQKYTALPEDLQLQHLTVAISSDPRGKPLSLFEYMNNDALLNIDLSKPAADHGNYIGVIPEAMMSGTEHVRRNKVKSLENQLPLVPDLLSSVALEAASEISRMYEYQISLMYDDISLKVLAEQAADCAIEYAHGHALDRNTIPRSVAYVYPPNKDGKPKLLSAVIGLKELKWDLYEIFKKPGLRKEKSLVTSEYPRELAVDLDPWSFHYQKNSEPFKFGYRGQLIDWDFHSRVYKLYEQEVKLYKDEIAYQEEDLHRLYKPYKRLFGAEMMERFCKDLKIHSKQDDPTADTPSLKKVLKLKSFGHFKEIEDIMPVYRPLRPHSETLDLTGIDATGMDMTRAKSVAVGVQPAPPVPMPNGHAHQMTNGHAFQNNNTRDVPPAILKQNGGMRSYYDNQHREPIRVEYANSFTFNGAVPMPAVTEGKSTETEIN